MTVIKSVFWKLGKASLKQSLLLQNTALQGTVLLKLKAFQEMQKVAALPFRGFTRLPYHSGLILKTEPLFVCLFIYFTFDPSFFVLISIC